MPSFYDIGDVYTVAVKVTDANGTAADLGVQPPVVLITLPDLTTKASPADFTVAHPGVGQYTAPYPITSYGLHTVAVTGTGTNQAAYADTFYVEAFRSIVGLQIAKDYLDKNGALDTADDEELRRVCVAATAAVEDYTGRKWASLATSLTFDVNGTDPILLPIGTTAVSAVTEWGTTLATADYLFDSFACVLYRRFGPYSRGTWRPGLQCVTVTCTRGSTTVPAAVRHATLEVVAELWSQQNATLNPTTEDYTSAPSVAIPKRVAQMLDPHTVPAMA